MIPPITSTKNSQELVHERTILRFRLDWNFDSKGLQGCREGLLQSHLRTNGRQAVVCVELDLPFGPDVGLWWRQ